MSFVDVRFVFFFPTVLVLWMLTPKRFRWVPLLIASYIFYMAFKASYGLLLFAITCIDYVAGLAMGADQNEHRRRLYLAASICANLGILFYFKYFNFFFTSLHEVLGAAGIATHFPLLNIILPIGISFHIFQSMSYTIEVYRRKFTPVKHFGKFALYVSFFPQLAAGPIERPQGLLKQIVEGRQFSLEMAQSGTRLMLWGFFKKLVIADNIATAVSAVYAHSSLYPGPSLVLATALFAYQIYCDFSGYTDIARGAARFFGYELMINFNRPFHAISMTDFWNRWHISLTSWLREYLYQPLVFSSKRITPTRIYTSLFVTLTLIGLWHGANWTYVVFGALHGMYLVVGGLTGRWRSTYIHTPRFLKQLTVFALVCTTYVFFRSPTINIALSILAGLGRGIPSFFASLTSVAGLSHVVFMDSAIWPTIVGLAGIVALELVEALHARGVLIPRLIRTPEFARMTLYAGAICAILLLGSFSSGVQFIYFQF